MTVACELRRVRNGTGIDMQAEDTSQLKPTRASFIRGLPESMPIGEVIERGREAGLEIKPSDIHAARYYMRQAAASQSGGRSAPELVHDAAPASPTKGVYMVGGRSDINKDRAAQDEGLPERVTMKTRAKLPPTAPAAKLPPKPAGSLDEQLRDLVMRMGTVRARAIIEQIEDLARK